MKRIVVLLAACLLTACANGVIGDQVDQGRAQAIQDADAMLHDCLLRAAHRVDDHRTEATSVGYSAIEACSNERSRDTTAHLEGLDRLTRELQRDEVADNQQQMATAAVLEERAAKH